MMKGQGWKDLLGYNVGNNDIVVRITASGYAPYVYGTLEKANKEGPFNRLHRFVIMDPRSHQLPKNPVELMVGTEFVTGSTRMKAGDCSENGFKIC